MNHPKIDKIKKVIDTIVINGGKTDLDSQIMAIESLNENLLTCPLFISIIGSLKELKGNKNNYESRNKN